MLVDALPVRPRTRVRFPPPPFPELTSAFRSEHLAVRGLDRNRCPHSVAVDLAELLLQVGGGPLDVDVGCRAHISMAEQLLCRVDVSGGEVELRPGRVAGTVHLPAACRALVDDPGAREASIPPAVHCRPGKPLAPVLPKQTAPRAALLGVEQVLHPVTAQGDRRDLLA